MLANAFVEIYIIFIIDIVLFSKPNSFVIVYFFPFPNCSLYLLGLLFSFFFYLKVFFFRIRSFDGNFFLNLLLVVDVDREVNELRVPLYNFRDFLMTKEFKCIFLEVDSNDCSTSEGVSFGIFLDCV